MKNITKLKMYGLLSIFLLFLTTGIYGESRFIQVEHTFQIQINGEVERMELTLALPKDYKERQKIHTIKYSKRPKLQFNEFGSKYATFAFERLRANTELKVAMFIEIKDYDWTTANLIGQPKTLKKKHRKRLTKNSDYYELPDDFVLPVEIDNQDTISKKVEIIHDFVVNHLEYQTFLGKDLGATHALTKKLGDCTEYAALMIALCRKQNIPARQVSGFTAKKSSGLLGEIFKSSNHAWVEVFFDEYGWIPFDPTHSDGGGRSTNFSVIENKYIYLHKDNLDSSNSKWKWWGGTVDVRKERNWQEFVSLEEMMVASETFLVK